jgi:phytanoyl-CoA hydroxylase
MMAAINDAELRRRLDREGYAVLRGFMPPDEVAALTGTCDAVIDWQAVHPPRMPEVTRPGGITFVNEQVAEPEHAEALRRIGLGPRFAALAHSVIGERAGHYLWQVVYKHAGFDEPFCWHQDHIHTPTQRCFYNVWVALSDMTVENGCLWVLPGVGLDRILDYVDTPYGPSCWPLDHPKQGVPIEIPRGHALVVTSRTLHKSGGNRTAGTRKAVLFAFMEQGAVAHGRLVRLHPYEIARQETAFCEAGNADDV